MRELRHIKNCYFHVKTSEAAPTPSKRCSAVTTFLKLHFRKGVFLQICCKAAEDLFRSIHLGDYLLTFASVHFSAFTINTKCFMVYFCSSLTFWSLKTTSWRINHSRKNPIRNIITLSNSWSPPIIHDRRILPVVWLNWKAWIINVPQVSSMMNYRSSINPIVVKVPILYPLKIPENLWFSGVFGRHKMETLTTSGLTRIKKTQIL